MNKRMSRRSRILAVAMGCCVVGASTAANAAGLEEREVTRRDPGGVGIAIRADLERDHHSRGERERRHRGEGRNRGGERRGRHDDCGTQHAGTAAIGVGLACCVVGALIPLGETTDDHRGDQEPDPRWDSNPPQAEYNAANVLLVATGVGLVFWGIALESSDHTRRFTVSPGAIPDGSHDGLASGVVATFRF